MITLLKTAKKERGAAYKAMKSDAGKGAAFGGFLGGGFGFTDGSYSDPIILDKEVGPILGGVAGGVGGAAVGAGSGAIDGYIGQKVLGGEFDDSYMGSIKRNVTGGAITGAGLGLLTGKPINVIKGSGLKALEGGIRGTVGKAAKDELVEHFKD